MTPISQFVDITSSWLQPQLLLDLRTLVNARPRTSLGAIAINRLLDIFQYPPSSDPLPSQRWVSPEQDEEEVVQPRTSLICKAPIVEITSPTAGGGKTSLVYYIIAKAILPAKYLDVNLDGKSSTVIYLDTDGRFSGTRIRQVLAHYATCTAKAQLKTLAPDEIEALVLDSLYHIHVLKPHSSSSLHATIENLPAYLLSCKGHFSSHRVIHSIILDSASAFYWQDRMDEELARHDPSNAENNHDASKTKISISVIKSLRDLQHTFSCAIVYTTWGLSPVRPQQQGPTSFRPHLPNPWPLFPTLRLVVERESVPKFGPHMSIEQALRDAPKRQEAVDRGRFVGWIDRWGSDEWSDGIKSALRDVEGKGFFTFRVTEEGLLMDGDEDKDEGGE